MTTLDLKVNLSDKLVEHLQQEAATRQISLDVIVGEVLEELFRRTDRGRDP